MSSKRATFWPALLCAFALGCGGAGAPGKQQGSPQAAKGPITSAVYERILKEKMTEEQVTGLLGPGREERRPTTPPDMKEVVWQDGKGSSIMIQFKDGKAHGGKSTIRHN